MTGGEADLRACPLRTFLSCFLAALHTGLNFYYPEGWSVPSLLQLLLRPELPARAAEQSIRHCSLAGNVSPLQMSLSVTQGSCGGVRTSWLQHYRHCSKLAQKLLLNPDALRSAPTSWANCPSLCYTLSRQGLLSSPHRIFRGGATCRQRHLTKTRRILLLLIKT